MELSSFYDISPLISERIAVFPGDQVFRRQVAMDFSRGDHLGLSSVQTTVHVGAHTDAPSHYHANGDSMESRELSRYFGSCQVIEVRLKRGERIRPEHLPSQKIQARRVLFKTGSFPNPDQWNGDFNSLSPELIDLLADLGVVLVGLDTPSVDPADSKALESHQAIHRRDLGILEGVVLDEVPAGVYTLVALPLRIEGADASPVRAILVKEFSR